MLDPMRIRSTNDVACPLRLTGGRARRLSTPPTGSGSQPRLSCSTGKTRTDRLVDLCAWRPAIRPPYQPAAVFPSTELPRGVCHMRELPMLKAWAE